MVELKKVKSKQEILNEQIQISKNALAYKLANPPSEDSWVDDFMNWVVGNLNLYYVEGLDPKSRKQNGKWVEYGIKNKGVYSIKSESSLNDFVYDWLKANDLHMSTYYVNEGLARLKTRCTRPISDFDCFNPKQPIVNCKGGYWYPYLRYLTPHTELYLSLKQFDCNLLYEPSTNPDPAIAASEDMDVLIQLEEQMPCWMSLKQYYPFEMNIIERYIQAILFSDTSLKMMLYMVGGSNTAKSTIANLIISMFEGAASFQPLDDLEREWGLMALIGNKVNIDTDSGMGTYHNTCLSRLKKIVGDPGKPIETPIIYGGSQPIIFSPFFITAVNQFPHLPKNVNRSAWGKRALCLVLNHEFEDNEDFEKQILLEKDALFTYLCLKPYHPISRKDDFGGFREFVNRNLSIWDLWADPIRKILNEVFERSEDVNSVYLVSDVEGLVYEIMERRQLEVNNRTDKQIVRLFKTMKIDKTVKQIKKEKYDIFIGLKLKANNLPVDLDPIEQFMLEETKEEPPKENKPEKVLEKTMEKLEEKRTEPFRNMVDSIDLNLIEHENSLEQEETIQKVEKKTKPKPKTKAKISLDDRKDPIMKRLISLRQVHPKELSFAFEDIVSPFTGTELKEVDVLEKLKKFEEKGYISVENNKYEPLW